MKRLLLIGSIITTMYLWFFNNDCICLHKTDDLRWFSSDICLCDIEYRENSFSFSTFKYEFKGIVYERHFLGLYYTSIKDSVRVSECNTIPITFEK